MMAQQPRPKKKRSRQQLRTIATRRRLLEGARSAFAKKGLDLTRIDEITEQANVGKGTFYYHFENKEELVQELIRNTLRELTSVIETKCLGAEDLPGLLDTLIGAHIEFFSSRWEDFVLYFQGRTDLTIEDGYSGIETPFLRYLECIEKLVSSVISFHLPRAVLRRIACAVAGFVSGYYSFAAISSLDEDIDKTFRTLRGAMVTSLARFIKDAAAAAEPSA